MKKVRSALRTARSLMAQGILGSDLWQGVLDAHSNLTTKERKKLFAAVKKEVGVLGQVLHNPNLYRDCRTAKTAKENHPQPHALLLTQRTPMCASCSFNRQGRCALMGGRLATGPTDVTEEIVIKTAHLLAAEGQLPKSETAKIAKASLPAHKRVAALNLRKVTAISTPESDTKDRARSRRIAAMMDQNGVSLDVDPARKIGSGRAKNAENVDANALFAEQPGDKKIAKKARRVAKRLQQGETRADLGDASPLRQDIRLANVGCFDIPVFENGRNATVDVNEEHMNHAQHSHDKLVDLSSRLMRAGRMTAAAAEKIGHRLEELRQYGALPTDRQARIARQLYAMSGGLEL